MGDEVLLNGVIVTGRDAAHTWNPLVGVRGRVTLTVLAVSAVLFSLLGTIGFVRIAEGGRNSIEDRIDEVLDDLELAVRQGSGTVDISTAELALEAARLGGIGHDKPTDDGQFWLERIECQAACTHAPVMTVDWEFMDDMSVDKMRDVVEKLRNGDPVESTRGPEIRSFRATERSLAGIDDGLADVGGNNADEVMLRGLTVAKDQGMPVVDGGAK